MDGRITMTLTNWLNKEVKQLKLRVIISKSRYSCTIIDCWICEILCGNIIRWTLEQIFIISYRYEQLKEHFRVSVIRYSLYIKSTFFCFVWTAAHIVKSTQTRKYKNDRSVTDHICWYILYSIYVIYSN